MTQAKKQPESIATPPVLLQMAVEKGADVEALTKLMDLQERWQKTEAKVAFDRAIMQFQAKCPEIKKDKKVNFNNVNYAYAPLSSIKAQIAQPMQDCGLSYRWETEPYSEKNGVIKVKCIITHELGHSESNEMGAFADNSGAKNDIQQAGSTLTYLQRYTLIGALGIATADEDNDGQTAGRYNIEPLLELTKVVRENFFSVYQIKQGLLDKDLNAAAEAWFELTKEEKEALFLAPTKGGILTTEERKVMQSKEFRDAHFGEGNPGSAWTDENV